MEDPSSLAVVVVAILGAFASEVALLAATQASSGAHEVVTLVLGERGRMSVVVPVVEVIAAVVVVEVVVAAVVVVATHVSLQLVEASVDVVESHLDVIDLHRGGGGKG